MTYALKTILKVTPPALPDFNQPTTSENQSKALNILKFLAENAAWIDVHQEASRQYFKAALILDLSKIDNSVRGLYRQLIVRYPAFFSADESQILVIVGTYTGYVSRNNLIALSEKFDRMLSNKMQESRLGQIKIDSRNLSLDDQVGFLRYLQVGQIVITPENVSALMQLANEHLLPDLKKKCRQSILDHYKECGRAERQHILEYAIEAGEKELLVGCIRLFKLDEFVGQINVSDDFKNLVRFLFEHANCRVNANNVLYCILDLGDKKNVEQVAKIHHLIPLGLECASEISMQQFQAVSIQCFCLEELEIVCPISWDVQEHILQNFKQLKKFQNLSVTTPPPLTGFKDEKWVRGVLEYFSFQLQSAEEKNDLSGIDFNSSIPAARKYVAILEQYDLSTVHNDLKYLYDRIFKRFANLIPEETPKVSVQIGMEMETVSRNRLICLSDRFWKETKNGTVVVPYADLTSEEALHLFRYLKSGWLEEVSFPFLRMMQDYGIEEGLNLLMGFNFTQIPYEKREAFGLLLRDALESALQNRRIALLKAWIFSAHSEKEWSALYENRPFSIELQALIDFTRFLQYCQVNGMQIELTHSTKLKPLLNVMAKIELILPFSLWVHFEITREQFQQIATSCPQLEELIIEGSISLEDHQKILVQFKQLNHFKNLTRWIDYDQNALADLAELNLS